MLVTPLGFCLRVTVNEKSLNLEKTTSSVLSVLLLIYVSNPPLGFILNLFKKLHLVHIHTYTTNIFPIHIPYSTFQTVKQKYLTMVLVRKNFKKSILKN